MNTNKSPFEMLYEHLGITPQHFAKGGPALTPEQMRALLIIHGHQVPKYGIGGAVNFGLNGLQVYPEAKDLYDAASHKDAHKTLEHGVNLADTVGSMVNIPYALMSYLVGSGDVGAGTLGEEPQHDFIHDKISAPLSKYLFNLGNKK